MPSWAILLAARSFQHVPHGEQRGNVPVVTGQGFFQPCLSPGQVVLLQALGAELVQQLDTVCVVKFTARVRQFQQVRELAAC